MKRFLSSLVVICITLGPTLAHAQMEEGIQASTPESNLVVTATRVHKDGQAFYELHATGIVRATPQQTWKVLTNYSDMYKFVPNLVSSKLVSRTDQEAIIEQKWVKKVLFFTHTVNLVVRATEHPISSIDITLVSGEMKQYSANWEIAPIELHGVNGTRITYYGKIEPDSYLPSFFGTSIMLSDLQTMMRAVLIEIDK